MNDMETEYRLNLNTLKMHLGDKTIQIVLDINGNPWFNGNEVASFLGYVGQKQALKLNVSPHNKEYLANIAPYFTKLYKNAQSNTIYINEVGFHLMILKSKKDPINIFEWLGEVVLPLIKKYYSYKITSELEDKYRDLTNQYNNLLSVSEKLLEQVKTLKKANKRSGENIQSNN